MGRRFTGALVLAAMALVPDLAVAQGREITGKVLRGANSSPMAEVTVSEVGGLGVARTAPDGSFHIRTVAGDVRLLVRAIGFQRKEVLVNAGENTVEVRLEEDPFRLEEVVVTGQTTTLERRNATTAVAKVASDELTNAPAQALEQALQGKVLGATISMNSGAPGGGGQVTIRGVTSILGQGQPLFVVDGVIISNDAFSAGANSVTGAGGRTTAAGIGGSQDALVNRLADLNPAEIESVEILKSAAATAIYGSRATNGVVVIRTKRGAPGTPSFNATGRIGTSRAYRLLGTRQFTTVEQVLNIPYGNGATGEAVLNQLYPNGTIPRTRNYLEEFYDNSTPSHELTVSYSGGSQGTQYFVNVTERNETGTAPNTSAKLRALRTNIDQSFADGKFKFNVGLNITQNVLNRGLSNNDNTCTSPIYCFGYTPGVINLDSITPSGLYVRNPFNGGGRDVSNPFETFEFLKLEDESFRQTGNLTGTWSAVNLEKHQVSLTLTGGFDRAQVSGDLFSPAFLQYENPAATDGFSGRSVRTEGNILNYNGSLVANWGFQPTRSVSLTTSVGLTYENQYNRVVRTRARGLLPGVETSNSGTVLDYSDGVIEFRDEAFFINEQILALDDRLALTGGVRADRSSANGDRDKFYYFPRASASYRIPDISTMVNEVKLRAGWGHTGNRPNYAARDLLLASGGVIGGNATLVQAGTAGNPQVKPETLSEIEGGIDLTLANRRLQFEGTLYRRKITDLLLQPATIPSGGLGARFINGGELSNRGIELGLSYVAVQRRDLDWNLRATWQKNKQEIKSLPADVPRFPAPGSFGAAFGRNFITSGGRTTWIWGNVPLDANLNPLPIGVRITNPSSVALTRDTVAADANPDFVMNFNSLLTWKRLSLALTMDWRQGGYVANMTRTLWDEGGTSRDYDDPVSSDIFHSDWDLDVPSGLACGNGTEECTAGPYRYGAWSNGSDVRAYLEDGGFLRVRDVSVSYEMPNRIARALGGRTMRLTFQARNPFMFTGYWSFDPEFNNFGATNLNRFIDLAPFPSMRQFFFSVDVGW
ncbi:MAG: SusC/RagA family TonB-linked outer membrane protein [Gemmatimonadales bacterium]